MMFTATKLVSTLPSAVSAQIPPDMITALIVAVVRCETFIFGDFLAKI